MKQEKRISVIVPVYNAEKYLRRCMDSIVGQTYQNLEIIVIDDGSVDDSGKILDKYKSDKRCIILRQSNKGQACARNVGLALATGEYISFIDSDDYIEIDMYEHMIDKMERYGCDISICNYYKENKYQMLLESPDWAEGLRTKREALIELFEDNTFCSFLWNKIFKKDLLKGLKFVPGKVMEDYLIMPYIFKKADKVYITNKRLYIYNIGNENSTSNAFNTKLFFDVCYANRVRYESFAKSFSEIEPHLFHMRMASSYRFWIETNINNFSSEEMEEEYKEAFFFIRRNLYKILGHGDIPMKLKIESIMVVLFPRLFRAIRNRRYKI